MAEEESASAEDRTEAPSQRRLEQAQREGQAPVSREAIGFATLLAGTVAGVLALPPLGFEWLRLMRALIEMPGEGAVLAPALLWQSALTLLPVLALVALAGTLASLAQTGLVARAEALAPQLSRVNPVGTLRRLLGPEGLLELLRTLMKLALVGVALWHAVDLSVLQAALHQPAAGLLRAAGQGSVRLLLAALFAFGAIALLDLFWVRWRHLRRMRMSREELRQEHKDSEGDPYIKARLRRLREQRARRRMLAAVPKATVVVTNPTHYAIALNYAPGQASAPRLVAKGVDAMAARIRAMAAEHGVPVVENPPLARALWRVETDTEIPAEHWQAVAEIIAYVWRLQGRQHA
ncbi:EscU/YscU/HrcU family type III secretion system export apparatus switch protein [Belnapia rosea]|uniref:Flagellar biosynthetic protein FlhB n=1 Tax=Belnapia rosea TaxID=938405 RepID=A0A1G6PFA0_9PROT|nr:EscU/YscU/HrcU family type III secretion system export apparatus switch protein [Belnapia rosea]SDC78196.1 flagellar biosynthetic protein FlhB [Belnapia rosea]